MTSLMRREALAVQTTAGDDDLEASGRVLHDSCHTPCHPCLVYRTRFLSIRFTRPSRLRYDSRGRQGCAAIYAAVKTAAGFTRPSRPRPGPRWQPKE